MAIQSDTAAGIRRKNIIDKLPISELTDEEIIKFFSNRFDVEALALVYMDKKGEIFCFGRRRRNKNAREFLDYIWNMLSIGRGQSAKNKRLQIHTIPNLMITFRRLKFCAMRSLPLAGFAEFLGEVRKDIEFEAKHRFQNGRTKN
jgi:hypothetical protein